MIWFLLLLKEKKTLTKFEWNLYISVWKWFITSTNFELKTKMNHCTSKKVFVKLKSINFECHVICNEACIRPKLLSICSFLSRHIHTIISHAFCLFWFKSPYDMFGRRMYTRDIVAIGTCILMCPLSTLVFCSFSSYVERKKEISRTESWIKYNNDICGGVKLWP